jgi:monolysocardiolipin acyltransferase
MEPEPRPPSMPWRFGSAAVMGIIGTLSRAFIYGANSQETHGLDGFLELIDKRADIDNRRRGLITGEWGLRLLWVGADDFCAS